ncbi:MULTISPECIES: NUDIX domain-containing protein [Streptomyces]|uniref:NUDIX hydrolase n=2 Tax=Streptomyces TaxID=1883 RepID=A0ABU2RK25_9ACTN|nr:MULTISPECIES: NUDIX hydrolase [unclassified Streptomyces]MBK3591856.1 NUDIX hydrolase [Streptomyces sp. MBT51]MDT0429196.1 NUDIX hydrolase [Streptomyces sp. DSM 41770]HBF80784.1 NUDIX domain-containing protein [Streptomyces sp.]
MSDNWLPPAEYVATLPKATLYACFFVTDEDDRPIQLRAARDPGLWQWPGGNMDAGETPWDCAVREGLEETGLLLAAVPRLLGVHFLTERADWPALKVGLVFDGGRLTSAQIGRIVLDPGEHSEAAVRSLQEWQKDMSPGSFDRLAAVAEARRTGAACYLQQTDPG